ncbi:MAG: hypothetical protein H5T95_14170 [Firmicutes bacterium]|nr:hypothetical protein [Bacillota bacterium]
MDATREMVIEDEVNRLKAYIDCRELIASDLGESRWRGQNYWQWLCPFHADSNPSLTAYKDGWTCFGCGAHGDAIAWVQKYKGLTFLDAVRELGGYVPPSAPVERPPANTPKASHSVPSEAWRRDALRAVEEFHRCLLSPEGARARKYLHRRGITDDDIRTWRLGYIPADRQARWGDVEVRLPRGIAIPALVNGVPWYVKVRRPAGDPKYVHVKGGRSAMFGYDHLQCKADLLLCEGEFDAILMRRLVGDVLDVATFGSASVSNVGIWVGALVVYSYCWLGFDNDPAGDKAREMWYELTARVRHLYVPAGDDDDRMIKDWTEAWMRYGEERLREYVLRCLPVK